MILLTFKFPYPELLYTLKYMIVAIKYIFYSDCWQSEEELKALLQNN
jgi:hypothetical protein